MQELKVRRGEKTRLPGLGLGPGLLGLLLLLGLSACEDNVGRAFDPKGGGSGGGNQSPGARLLAPPPGGLVFSERPHVVEVRPQGSTQTTSPVVVLFSEAMNIDSIADSSTETPSHLYVRVQNTDEPLPGTYDLMMGGRLLVFRPQPAFPPDQTFEVVAGNAVRDIDRATLSKAGVLATFTTDIALEAGPSVVFDFPARNSTSQLRESEVFLVLSQVVDRNTVNDDSFFLRESGKTEKIAGAIQYPITVLGAGDTRIISFTPSNTLAASTKYEFVYTEDIKAGEVNLDVGNLDPPIIFTTQAPVPPKAIEVSNPTVVGTTTFSNRVNRNNLGNLMFDVEFPADTEVGDRLTIRIYGDDPKSETDGVVVFSEKEFSAAQAGEHTETFDMSGQLGSLGAEKFGDGPLTLATRLARNNQVTGFVLASGTAQDTVQPALLTVGPPLASNGINIFLTDLNAAALHGKASEQLGAVELTVKSVTVPLFASASDGRFMTGGFFLDRNKIDVPFALNIYDSAGNQAATSFPGSFRQRGILTGPVGSGGLTVQVYDEATLQDLAGVTVQIERGMPTDPGTAQQNAITDANGLAVFSGLSTTEGYSITLIKDGYHLRSILDTKASYASLPLRPIANATVGMTGIFGFTAIPGLTARAGINLLDDDSKDGMALGSATNPTQLTTQTIRANRTLTTTGYVGTSPPSAKPTFLFSSSELAASSAGNGVNLPPQPVAAGGTSVSVTLPFQAAALTSAAFLAPYTLDLTAANSEGFDAGSLAGPPQVNLLGTFAGFAGVSLMGLGFANGTGLTKNIDGNYNLLAIANFAVMGPLLWSSVQFEDTAGNLSRVRAPFLDPALGSILNLRSPPGIPTITAPSGPFTKHPSVIFADRIDTSSLLDHLGFHEIRIVGPNKRRWDLLYLDSDASGTTDTVQVPLLLAGSPAALAKGDWSLRVVDFVVLGPGMSGTEFVFEELQRLQLTYARSTAVDHEYQ